MWWKIKTKGKSKRGIRRKSKGCFATFVERKTRFYRAIKIPNKSDELTYSAIEYMDMPLSPLVDNEVKFYK